VFQKILKKVAIELNKSKVPYMVIGGQAVLLYGEPRLTKDIDITLGIGIDKIDKIKQIVKEAKLKILIEDIENFVKKTYVLPTMDVKSGIRVDFIFSFSKYEQNAIKRAKKVKLEEAIVKFASLEDLIIHKIIAGRARDIEDIKCIIAKNKFFDHEYIEGRLSEFDKALNNSFLSLFKEILEDVKKENFKGGNL